MQERRAVQAAIGGFAGFVVAIGALHALNLDTLPRHVSGFVRLGDVWLWMLAMLALALGLTALGLALRKALPHDRDGRLGANLLVASGLMSLLLLIFPTDDTQLVAGPMARTWIGWVHNVSVVLSTMLVGAAMLVLVDAGRRSPAWSRAVGSSFAVPTVSVILAFAWGLGDLSPFWVAAAVIQRLLALVMVGWLVAVAVRLRNLEPAHAFADGRQATQ